MTDASESRDVPIQSSFDACDPMTQAERSNKVSAGRKIAQLQQMISDQLSSHLDQIEDFALLDFPNYPNVGDSLIWLGQIKFFEQALGQKPAYVCTKNTLAPARIHDHVKSGPIFMSGGGNFGDAWPGYQEYRISVLENCRDYRVVQLPQTIWFRHQSSRGDLLERTQRAIENHGRVHLLVRDRRSFDFAQTHFQCRVDLCPDMAFCLGLQVPPALPDSDIVVLGRDDLEGTGALHGLGAKNLAGIVCTDWITDTSSQDGLALKLARKASSVFRKLANERGYPTQWHGQALRRHRVGAGILSRGQVILTDRLHGHIFATLLNKPQIVLDNNYGKISGFISEWTHNVDNLRTAEDVETALELAQTLVHSDTGAT
ncbi:MAG: polysaccharide pyruvyl transferase family protein [Pseudomonadota bacterium]